MIRSLVVSASLLLGTAACDPGSPPAAEPGESGPVVEATEPGPAFRTTATIEDIMRYVVDPASDVIWEAVITEVTPDGVVEHVPETEEDWAQLRGQTLLLIEATNLLLMGDRPVAPEGSRSELPGVDLEPEQIEELLDENRGAWTAFVVGLQASATTVLDAVEQRDLDGLLVAGDGLDLACENCHVRYWYPSLDGTYGTR